MSRTFASSKGSRAGRAASSGACDGKFPSTQRSVKDRRNRLAELELRARIAQRLAPVPDKTAAIETGLSARCIRDLKGESHEPRVSTLRALADRYPEIAAAVRAYFALDLDADPEAQRLLADIMTYVSRRGG